MTDQLKESLISPWTPDEIDDEMDVIVIGGGGAGMSAAIEASKAGASVTILEKSGRPGGETLYAGGVMAGHDTFLTKKHGVSVTIDQVWKRFNDMPAVFGALDLAVARVVAEQGGHTIDWLASLGVPFEDNLFADQNYSGDMRIMHQVLGGGPGFTQPLLNAVTGGGAKVVLNTRVTQLLQDESGRVSGVVAECDGRTRHIRARRGVVLSSGGYAANKMMIELLNPELPNLGFVCSPESVGDGLIMASAIGAIVTRTSLGPMTLPAVEVESNGVFQWQALDGGGIAVGEDGKRFVAEDALYINGDLTRSFVHQISKQKLPYIWAIVNEGHALSHAMEIHPVTLVEADSITELAAKIAIDPEALRTTIERYNQACAEGNDAEFGRKKHLIPLSKDRLYAAKVRPSAVLTTGGLKIDPRARVLKLGEAKEEALAAAIIPGLFAAGQVAEWSAIGGWTVSSAFTMGRIAGREAAMVGTESLRAAVV